MSYKKKRVRAINLFVEESEKHLQVDDLPAADLAGCRALWQQMRAKYPGYEADFCYHSCEIPVDFMREIGASLLEECTETHLAREGFKLVCEIPAVEVTHENFSDFSEIHGRRNPEAYWNGERISDDLSRWCIYLYGDSYVMMALWSTTPEVFALEAVDADIGAGLLVLVAQVAFEQGKTRVLMMTDNNSPVQAEAARLTGFVQTGSYTAYRCVVK